MISRMTYVSWVAVFIYAIEEENQESWFKNVYYKAVQ